MTPLHRHGAQRVNAAKRNFLPSNIARSIAADQAIAIRRALSLSRKRRNPSSSRLV
jgi:hypothetical protein